MIKKLSVSIVIGSVVMFGISGCTTASNNTNVASLEKELAKKNKELEAKDKKIVALKDKADKNEVAASKVNIGNPADFNKRYPLLPENAKAGECFSRVLIPPVYEWKTKTHLKNQKSAQYKIVPATYKFVDQRQKVSEESFKLESVAATYRWEKDKVMVEPEKVKLIKVPAKYKMVTEKIMIREARDVWKQGTKPLSKLNNSTGEIVCKVHIPAEYKTITKKVVSVPAHTKKIVIPARYKYIKRKVIDVAAHTKKIVIPATYKMVKVKKLVTAVQKIKIDIPETSQTTRERVMSTKAHMKWQQILCETNTTPGIVMRLQKALKAKKYYHNKIDGVYGSDTTRAVAQYQKDKGIPSGALTLQTLKSLNVI